MGVWRCAVLWILSTVSMVKLQYVHKKMLPIFKMLLKYNNKHSLAMVNDAWTELIHITSHSAQVATAYISPGKLVIIVCYYG